MSLWQEHQRYSCTERKKVNNNNNVESRHTRPKGRPEIVRGTELRRRRRLFHHAFFFYEVKCIPEPYYDLESQTHSPL